MHFTKIPIIKRVCEIIGVKNCTDDETIFNEDKILPNLQEIEFSHHDWKATLKFNTQQPQPTSDRYISQCIAVLRSIILEWSGYKITKIDKLADY